MILVVLAVLLREVHKEVHYDEKDDEVINVDKLFILFQRLENHLEIDVWEQIIQSNISGIK